MNISKDEARLFSILLQDAKYNLVSDRSNGDKQEDICRINALKNLEDKLHEAGKDERRNGRASHNSFTDLLKRIFTKYN